MDTNELLLAITRCPEVEKARFDDNHRCHEIVCSQRAGDFQAPEPWRGHIETAPILFVSSNPSIADPDPDYPRADWQDDKIVEYFQEGFGRMRPEDRNRVPFWRSVDGIANRIFGHNGKVAPGQDYALTEIVHCKSTREQGVSEAQPFCPQKWLCPVMRQSGAKIIVLLGRHARDHCAARWHLDKEQRVHYSVPIAGRNRAVVILPHPNARGKRKIEDCVSNVQLEQLRALLRGK